MSKDYTTSSNFEALKKANDYLQAMAKADGYTQFTPPRMSKQGARNVYTITASNPSE